MQGLYGHFTKLSVSQHTKRRIVPVVDCNGFWNKWMSATSSRYYPGIHLYKVGKTIIYLRIASVPVKIRTRQHLNTNRDFNRHINLLGIINDRDRNNTYFLWKSKGKGPPPTLGVDEWIILKLILQEHSKGDMDLTHLAQNKAAVDSCKYHNSRRYNIQPWPNPLPQMFYEVSHLTQFQTTETYTDILFPHLLSPLCLMSHN
jgi:hypothetical protein